jgi:7-carboxy-7-deazaguanine synthase
MQITEIFRSIQGESSFAGLPCIFVRLTGCNLRCDWCDSEYTFAGGQRMTLDQVMAEVERFAPVKLVEITGGEPMLQEREVLPLMERLLASAYKVLLETSGERPLDQVPKEVVKVVDVKCPHSGEADAFRMSNLQVLQPHDEIKFVLSNRSDYEFARGFIYEHQLPGRVGGMIFSPAFRKDAQGARDASHCLLDPQELAEWILEDSLPVRLGLQIHKFIWQPEMKGV